jgi:hypothetical protein
MGPHVVLRPYPLGARVEGLCDLSQPQFQELPLRCNAWGDVFSFGAKFLMQAKHEYMIIIIIM